MPVQITVKGNQETNEYQDAIELKEIFESEFQNTKINGEILIISNVTLFGQETKDVDLVALGKLDNYSTRIKTKAKVRRSSEYEILDQKERQLYVNNFCFVFETKRHRAEDIQLNGVTLLVTYNNKLSDVTTQSENQKYALLGYLKDRLGLAPYICNFIWLKNVSANEIKNFFVADKSSSEKHNYLPNRFGLKWLFQLACVQQTPFNPADKETGQPRNWCQFSAVARDKKYDFDEIDSALGLFTRVKQGTGELTRKRIEQITKVILKDQKYAQAIGEKLVIISGRAGTGKTIKLLTIACDLAENQGARSLILTYNQALVSDIKRTLALAGIPDGIDEYSVNISTLHKFFYEILMGFEIGVTKNKKDKQYIPDYISQYETLLNELYTYIDKGLIEKNDLEILMKSRHQQIAWDYILIDEAQDWKEIEKQLIFFIFGKENVIIADGVDQLIRSQKKCHWTQGLKRDVEFRQTTEKRGLRQKTSLVSFVAKVAEKLYIPWDIEPKDDLYGGKVIIKIGDYTKDLHEREFKLCQANGNTAYEMMFLVPPALVLKAPTGRDEFGKPTIKRSFALKDDFNDKGIRVWDGTSTELRNSYAVELAEHRLFQYESCRGLEGWTVVCLELDEFMRYKFESFKEMGQDKLHLTFEEQRNDFINKWALIPLTRAIDTLVVTIKNQNSEIANTLRDIYPGLSGMHNDGQQAIYPTC